MIDIQLYACLTDARLFRVFDQQDLKNYTVLCHYFTVFKLRALCDYRSWVAGIEKQSTTFATDSLWDKSQPTLSLPDFTYSGLVDRLSQE